MKSTQTKFPQRLFCCGTTAAPHVKCRPRRLWLVLRLPFFPLNQNENWCSQSFLQSWHTHRCTCWFVSDFGILHRLSSISWRFLDSFNPQLDKPSKLSGLYASTHTHTHTRAGSLSHTHTQPLLFCISTHWQSWHSLCFEYIRCNHQCPALVSNQQKLILQSVSCVRSTDDLISCSLPVTFLSASVDWLVVSISPIQTASPLLLKLYHTFMINAGDCWCPEDTVFHTLCIGSHLPAICVLLCVICLFLSTLDSIHQTPSFIISFPPIFGSVLASCINSTVKMRPSPW